MKQQFDVFLSHSSKDKEWVAKLKNDLMQYGIKVWLDKDQIRPGEIFVHALEDAIDHCKAIVLVISPESIQSKWVQEEYARAISLEKQKGVSVQVIPVILETAEVPSFLSSRNYVDFREESKYSENIWKLVWGITGKKPDNRIDFESVKQIGVESRVTKKINFPPMTSKGNNPLYRKILSKINALIAHRGLDNEIWSKTIPEQYFLMVLAHALGLTAQEDYNNLLNRFLRNFHYRLDESMVLEPIRIITTPEEIEKILARMTEEDKNDDYYSKSAKTRVENIDPSMIRYNYMYGLTVHITGLAEQKKIMGRIHQLALDQLFHGDRKSPLDDYGGWQPYRVPWITARVLICLRNANYESRQDAPDIENVIHKALESLVNRIYQEHFWRSGVGEWVTEWESTALCLEALDAWDYIPYHLSEIRKVLRYVMDNQDKWLIEPDFSTGKSSNQTLSSVSLLSVIATIMRKYFDFDEYSFEYSKMLDYFDRCTNRMDTIPDPNSSQLCTIPQLAFYIVRELKE